MSPEIKHSEGCGKDNKVFVPLLERISYWRKVVEMVKAPVATISKEAVYTILDKINSDVLECLRARRKFLLEKTVFMEHLTKEQQEELFSIDEKFLGSVMRGKPNGN